jgi:hypothetical protein
MTDQALHYPARRGDSKTPEDDLAPKSSFKKSVIKAMPMNIRSGGRS